MSLELRDPRVWLAIGAAAALLVVVAAVGVLTQTSWGHERALAFTLRTLGGRITGEIEVQRLDGNLLTGARLYEVAIRGEDGSPLLVADSAYINYELPTFLGGDVIINRLELYSPDIVLYRMPGDTLWNYQKVLTDPSPGPDTAQGGATLIEHLAVVDGSVLVRLPWEPEEGLAPEAREEAVEVALADTSRLMVERVPGGFLRTMRFAVAEGELSELIIAPDERGGTLLEVRELTGLAWLWDGPPLAVEEAQGAISLREGVLRLQVGLLRLPDSRAELAGVVDLTGDEPRFDIYIEAPEVALTDLQWLYPPLPEEGEGQLRFWWETRPEGVLYLARDLELAGPDTRLWGDFGIVVGDSVQVVEADLHADPLDADFVGALVPAVPEGLRIQAASVEAPPADS